MLGSGGTVNQQESVWTGGIMYVPRFLLRAAEHAGQSQRITAPGSTEVGRSSVRAIGASDLAASPTTLRLADLLVGAEQAGAATRPGSRAREPSPRRQAA